MEQYRQERQQLQGQETSLALLSSTLWDLFGLEVKGIFLLFLFSFPLLSPFVPFLSPFPCSPPPLPFLFFYYCESEERIKSCMERCGTAC